MGPDKSKLTKARIELEELYSGIPDDSVNLTFQDFAEVNQSNGSKKINPPLDPLPDHSPGTEEVFPLARMPSLDFNRGLDGFDRSDHPVHYQNPVNHHRPHVFPLQSQYQMEDSYNHGSPAVKNLNRATSGGLNRATSGALNRAASGGLNRGASGGLDHGQQKRQESRGHHQISTPSNIQQYPNGNSPYSHAGFSPAMGTPGVYDDMSHMSGMSVATEKGGRRRPGIPHSNICTVCSNYIYIFRHRCLVCGRVYCRQCVGIGMGEMSEGRKCIECLGRRFSQRYIQKAGQVGCCAGYPTLVKQQELKWAEKGARKNGENRYGGGGGGGGGGGMMSQSVKYPVPRTPGRPNGTPASSAPTSFVISSPYSPYHSPISHAPF